MMTFYINLLALFMILLSCKSAQEPYTKGMSMATLELKLGTPYEKKQSIDLLPERYREKLRKENIDVKDMTFEIYHVKRTTSSFGMYRDYLIFDSNDLLIDYFREYLD